MKIIMIYNNSNMYEGKDLNMSESRETFSGETFTVASLI